MHIIKVTFALVLVGVASAVPVELYGDQLRQQQQQLSQGMPYDFDWAVVDELSGNDFGQRETSDGVVVQGEYFVLLPDGRRQTVKYTADRQSGFVADVQYEGEANFGAPGVQRAPVGPGGAGFGARAPVGPGGAGFGARPQGFPGYAR